MTPTDVSKDLHSIESNDDTRRRRHRRIAGRLALPLLAAVLCTTAAAPAAFAADVDGVTPPPSGAIAVPAGTFYDNHGDGGDYVAADDCHYYLDGVQWYSDLCYRAPADADGNPIPQRIGAFANEGDGDLGQEVLEIDSSDPSEIAVRMPTNPIFTTVAWLRYPSSNPTGPGDAMVHDSTAGSWVWIPTATLLSDIRAGTADRYGFSAPSSTTPTSTTPTSTTTSPVTDSQPAPAQAAAANPAVAEIEQHLADTRVRMLQIETEPPCDFSFNGCR